MNIKDQPSFLVTSHSNDLSGSVRKFSVCIQSETTKKSRSTRHRERERVGQDKAGLYTFFCD